jgi:hypothetical protein
LSWFRPKPPQLPSNTSAMRIIDLATTQAGLNKLLTDNGEFYKLAVEHLSKTFIREMEDKDFTADNLSFLRGAKFMLQRITQLVSQEINRSCAQNISKRGED